MAEGLEALRRSYRLVVTNTVGWAPRNRRQLEAEMQWSGHEAALLALPEDVTALATLQNGSTGAFPFQFDFSAFDGPDAWR